MRLLSATLTLLSLAATTIFARPGLDHRPLHRHDHHLEARATNRMVFAHFIVGIVSNRNGAADWDADMQRAKAYGIDAFALNIGVDDFTDTQLGYAYASANNNGMKVFISFDFNWWSTGSATAVGQMAAKYARLPAQLQVDGKAFVSTFVGDGLNTDAMRSAAGIPLYFAPNYRPSQGTSMSSVDAAFNWVGWPNNGNNRAPNPGQKRTVEAGDQQYLNALNGKDYMAPVSPWFFTHYGREVSYSKNWLFPGDTLWFDRWRRMLALGPRFIEIVSWNDYGESHYVGPLSSPHTDDGASKWINDMPHDGWLEMAKPFIAAYKAGATAVDSFITSDQLVYWYRPQPKGVNCDSTDTCMGGSPGGDYYIGRPDGYDTVTDSVFIVALLTSPATLQVISGSNRQTFQAAAGAGIYTVPMGTGRQSFVLVRASQTVVSGTSPKDIINGCVCGIYNFNAFVGTLPLGTTSVLDDDGLKNFAPGLRVSTCAATPTLSAQTAGSAPSSSSTSAQGPTTTTASTITTTRLSTTTTTTRSSSTTTRSTNIITSSTTSASPTSSQVCVSGSGSGNYGGLCSFDCAYGYCPSGPCTCNSYGPQATPPPSTGMKCVPADGLDDSYSGLCSFACDRGYQPPTACKAA